MKKIALLLLVLTSFKSYGQTDKALRTQIKEIAAGSKAIIGVSVLNIETRDTLTFNGGARLVMHSVFKFPIAMTILHMVDQRKLKLDQTIKIGKGDLSKMYSPMRDKYPEGADLPLSEVLGYMVSQSDNDACDKLIKIAGGPKAIENYMFSLGIKGIAIKASEADMASAWPVQYTNWCKPVEMTHLLDILYNGSALKKPTNDFLLQLMTATTTGPKRIKGLLPANTVVAHKTGTSPTNDAGLSPATNDVGIITMPNGKHIAIAVFVSNSTEDMDARELVIARIAKAVYDANNK